MTIEERIEFLKSRHKSFQQNIAQDEICIRPGLKFKIPESCRFAFEFWCWRSPEEMVLECDTFVKYAKGKKCFIDAGSHYGFFSLLFCALNDGATSFAFEPSPEPYKRLLENIALNNFKIEPSIRALSDKSGEITMTKEWEHYVESNEGVLAATVCGDTYFSEDMPAPIPVDCIKCDTEGMELKVLKGFRQTIEIHHPVIFLELHLTRLKKEEVDEIISFIESYNYIILDSRTDSVANLDIVLNEKTDLRLILL